MRVPRRIAPAQPVRRDETGGRERRGVPAAVADGAVVERVVSGSSSEEPRQDPLKQGPTTGGVALPADRRCASQQRHGWYALRSSRRRRAQRCVPAAPSHAQRAAASARACTTRRGSTLQSAHAVPASAQCMPPKARQRAQSWMRPEPLNASSATSKRRAMPKPGPPQALLVPNDSWPQRCCAGGALRRRARVRCSSSASILRCAAAGAASSAHVGCTARRAAAGSARPTDGAWPRQAHGAQRGCAQKQAAPLPHRRTPPARQPRARSDARCACGAWRRGAAGEASSSAGRKGAVVQTSPTQRYWENAWRGPAAAPQPATQQVLVTHACWWQAARGAAQASAQLRR